MATCDVPQRSWRDLVSLRRVVHAVLALGCFAAGAWLGGTVGLGLAAAGAGFLLWAVLLPTAREVTFGFPVAVNLKTAVRTREEALRQAFDTGKPELELCAHLLCTDPATSARLIEATWSRAARLWKGPAGPALHLYLLCSLVELIVANARWTTGEIGEGGAATPLGALPPLARVAVVLHDIAKLTTSQIATITGRPVEHVRADLVDAGAMVTSHWRAT